MPYLDNLLATGEQPLRREHQHWFVLVANARYALLAWVVAILLLILSGGIANDNGGGTTLRQILGYVVVVLIVGGLLFFGWQVLRWQNEEFIVTSRRVLQIEGWSTSGSSTARSRRSTTRSSSSRSSVGCSGSAISRS